MTTKSTAGVDDHIVPKRAVFPYRYIGFNDDVFPHDNARPDVSIWTN
jgi:hypothetical protein